MKKPDPYTVLGVSRNAAADTIRRAHRQRAKKAHPDAGGSDEQMREINDAALILRDPARRSQYDETGVTEQKDSAMQDVVALFIRL